MRLDPSFWAGKRVLVTGHTGFKGSWLALWLHQLQAEVYGIALPPESSPAHFDLLRLGERLAGHFVVDIRNEREVADAVAQISPDIAFHLAAQPIVRRAWREPVGTFHTNVMGTVHLLEALRRVEPLRAVVAITTDKVYRNLEWVWPYRETDTLGGTEPYGASKAACEMAIEAYRESYFAPRGIGVLSVRAGNVIGGGDWASDRLIPDFARSLAEGRELVIRNPDAVRPWQHVLEPLLGYLLAAQRLWSEGASAVGALNFGPDGHDFRTVRDVADACVAAWGQGASWRHEADVSIKESRLLTLDNALAKDALGWRPRWGFEDCIRHTIQWYRRYFEGADVRRLSLEQIAAFHSGES